MQAHLKVLSRLRDDSAQVLQAHSLLNGELAGYTGNVDPLGQLVKGDQGNHGARHGDCARGRMLGSRGTDQKVPRQRHVMGPKHTRVGPYVPMQLLVGSHHSCYVFASLRQELRNLEG